MLPFFLEMHVAVFLISLWCINCLGNWKSIGRFNSHCHKIFRHGEDLYFLEVSEVCQHLGAEASSTFHMMYNAIIHVFAF